MSLHLYLNAATTEAKESTAFVSKPGVILISPRYSSTAVSKTFVI